MNQEFSLAGWTLAPGIGDDGVHRRVDNMLFADRTDKGMFEEIQFDGTHRGIVTKKGIRLSFAQD